MGNYFVLHGETVALAHSERRLRLALRPTTRRVPDARGTWRPQGTVWTGGRRTQTAAARGRRVLMTIRVTEPSGCALLL